ncbi:GNAT family N-acetyltransferase [Myxococcus sp. 1LA]
MLNLINNHAHGYVVTPVVLACDDAGLFALLGQGPKDFDRLAEALRANRGHLRVAMRMFEALGWVQRHADDAYCLTEAASAHDAFPREAQALFALPMDRYLRGEEGLTLAPWLERSRASWGTDDALVRELLDGVIITPLMLALEQRGGLKEARGLADLWRNLERGDTKVPEHVQRELAGFFFAQKWTREDAVDALLTPKGAFLFERALLFAIVGSYRPMLASMPQLLFGDCEQVFGRDASGHELHLDRTLNVIGSGHQHRKYFAELEKLIISVFDAEDLTAQPRYIADMGCGDGTLLKRVYETVLRHTRRGKALDRFPLTLIAADFNEKALEAAGRTLAGLAHVTLRADVARPDRLIEELRAKGLSEPENTLHIRSFLDHDRPYQPPVDRAGLHARIPFDSVFVSRGGQEVVPAEVFHSLVEHLERWAAILHRHPLVILEVHCLPAPVVRRNLSQSESLHFDAYHRFSHQMLVEANHFLLAAAQAGLFARDDLIRRFPRTLSFTRMTLTQFEKRPYRIRWARPGDLPALERLERECWDAELRAPDAVLKARIEKHPQGQLVLELDGQVVGAIYSQRISDDRVLRNATAETVDSLHVDGAPVVQLLGVNVSPSAQHSRLGDRLLEFMLQYCGLSNDVIAVVGVTRCKAYGRHAHLPLAHYVASRDEHGLSVDPVLRFHQLHGAELGELIAGYRVRDTDNHGHGVMVRYDVHTRVRRDAPVDVAEAESPIPDVTTRGSASAETEPFLRQLVARIVECDAADVRMDLPLMELGVDSVGLMELAEHIGRRFELKLEETFFFEHNTLNRIGAFLEGRHPSPVVVKATPAPEPVPVSTEAVGDREIAIVGVACRLPGGVQTPRQLWEKLIARQSLVGTLDDIRWRWSGLDDASSRGALGHVAHAGDVDRFDAGFFNISPAEAELMDPQQRLMLELSWQCIEDAGHDPLRMAGSDTGVFIGASGSDYKTLQDKYGRDIAPHYAVATSTSVIPNRISYFFDFSGPSVQVDTACSSSLVALDQALRALRNQECGQALVAAVSLICEPSNTVCFQRAGMLAEDGRCKTFDARANGYVRGEGAVVFLLKPLKQAVADKDSVYGVVLGSAVNHGGRTAGLTAPSPQKQAELVCKALQAASVTPEEVGYIEAHGTGTSLGDPVETKGLVTAFERLARVKGAARCALGSVKTNIGHLEAAAGAAGLLKALLCLEHKRIPANLHFEQLNPRIAFTGTPFYVSHEEHAWTLPEGQARRVAGVSSFGSGGTNAHVLVREHVAPRPARDGVTAGGRYLVLLSARTERALERREADLISWLRENPQEDLGDLSASLAMGRAHWTHRSAYVVSSHADLCEQLSAGERRHASPAGPTKFDSLRKQRFLQRLQQVFPQDLLPRAAREGAAHHDDLCVLADLYLLGSEFDWRPMFGALLTRKLRLPAYPFERDSYWLRPGETARDVPAVAKTRPRARRWTALVTGCAWPSDGCPRRWRRASTGGPVWNPPRARTSSSSPRRPRTSRPSSPCCWRPVPGSGTAPRESTPWPPMHSGKRLTAIRSPWFPTWCSRWGP